MENKMENKVKWLDIGSHIPTERELCIVMYNSQKGLDLTNVAIHLADPLTRMFITDTYPHPTGEKFNIHGLDNDIVIERYQNKRNRIPFSDVDKWAYVKDVLNF